jgi:anti-sigma factor RsiW
MKCARAQALIESASFTDWPAADRQAAQRHAQGCEACRPFLASETELVANLQSLSSPADVVDLTAAVMARIERAATPSSADPPQRETDAAAWWRFVASALTIGVALVVWGPQASSVSTALPRSIGFGGVSRGVVQPAFALISIALYLAALMMPLRRRREV